MRKFLVHDEIELQQVLSDEPNLDETGSSAPKVYPAIVIVAYAGEGWDELSFVYPDDFKTNSHSAKFREKPLDCVGVDTEKQSTGKVG